MKRMPNEDAKMHAAKVYKAWISVYGLANSQKIHRELGRKLRDEAARRKKLDPPKPRKPRKKKEIISEVDM